MSKSGDLDWPPRSPDLTPPDFFLWGYLKPKVYVNKPRTVEELKDNIGEEITAIPAEMLAKTMENAAKRAQNDINARSGDLRDIIFKNIILRLPTAKFLFFSLIFNKKNIGPSNMGNPVYLQPC